MQHFRKIASGLNVSDLAQSIWRNENLFDLVTLRQDHAKSPHRDTRAIYLRWAKEFSVDTVFTDLEAVDRPEINYFPHAIDIMHHLAAAVGGQKLGRVMIVSLKPGGVITPHSDEGLYADTYERFHLVIKSSEGSYFYVQTEEQGGEFVTMKVGDLWWFNHKKPHFVLNNSSDPRIHLIVDMVAPEYRVERAA